jgi:hypothetical protein
MRARPPSRVLSLAALLLAGSLSLGCESAPVLLELNFPTTTAFMISEQGRVRIFTLGEGQLGLCPQLLEALPTSSFPLPATHDSGLTDACALRDGLALPTFEGPHAYLVEMRNTSNELVLRGCTVAELWAGAPDVRVELYPTDAYAAAAAMPPGGTPETRCGGGAR